jgi:hypothetical protein
MVVFASNQRHLHSLSVSIGMSGFYVKKYLTTALTVCLSFPVALLFENGKMTAIKKDKGKQEVRISYL